MADVGGVTRPRECILPTGFREGGVMRDAGESWMRAVDARLVSNVQAVAGARCHESANLLQHYYLTAHACARLLGFDLEAARKELQEIEAGLRRFVCECRSSGMTRMRPALALA
jgi:hypothetical protein